MKERKPPDICEMDSTTLHDTIISASTSFCLKPDTTLPCPAKDEQEDEDDTYTSLLHARLCAEEWLQDQKDQHQQRHKGWRDLGCRASAGLPWRAILQQATRARPKPCPRPNDLVRGSGDRDFGQDQSCRDQLPVPSLE